jgi:hypothetical protein
MKITNPKNIRLVKIPQEADFALFLIQEELKSRRLMKDIQNAGFDSSIRSADFSSVIFSTIGFVNQSASFYKWYKGQLDVFCKDIDLLEGDSLSKQAFAFYIHLMIEKMEQGENT